MPRTYELKLRRLAAELREEIVQIDRTLSEFKDARTALIAADAPPVVLYGAAALLDTFYTGVEKGMTRIARLFGGLVTATK